MKQQLQIGLKIARLLERLEPESRRDLARHIYRTYVGLLPLTAAERASRYRHGRSRDADVTRDRDDNHGVGRDASVTKRSDPTPSSFLISSSTPVVSEAVNPKDYPKELQDIPVFLANISAPRSFEDPKFWTRIDAWLGAANSGVGYLDELPKYLAWWQVQSGARKHRDLQRGFRNWLAKSEYWSQARAQTHAVRKSR